MPQTFRAVCLKCSAAYELPEEYVASYGGQVTQCHNCGGPITIPIAPPPLPAGAVAVLPYAGPVVVHAGGIWRDGKILVTTTQAVLPGRCVKCNQPVTELPMNRKLRWQHPALALLILLPFGILIYIVVALVTQKTGHIQLSLCARHRRRRQYNILATWLTALVGAGLIALAIVQQSGVPAICGSVLLVGAAVWAIVGCGILPPKRIDHQFMWLRGAGAPFLDTLPELR